MMSTPESTYEQWLMELQQLAEEQNLSWLISARAEGHRQGYDKGLTPEGELAALADLSEWRGCGCGGGGG
jgi:hypothetical protein